MKKYYWLKLQKDFFKDPRIKKLRRIAGGDTYTLIYLELMLLSLETDGILTYEGIEPTFEAELSLIIDEDETNIKVVLDFLTSQGLMEQFENKFSLRQVLTLIGSECDSAERVRKLREKKKEQEALQCNIEVTSGNKNVTTEIRDKSKEKIYKKENPQIEICEEKNSDEKLTSKKKFIKPTPEDLISYKQEKNLNVDCESFYDYYEAKGWMIGRSPMKDWQATMRNWSRNQEAFKPPKQQTEKNYEDDYEWR